MLPLGALTWARAGRPYRGPCWAPYLGPSCADGAGGRHRRRRHGADPSVLCDAASWCGRNEQMVTDNTPQLSGLFGVYLQVGDLHRSLSFYCDVLALEVVWNDGALAVLHTHRAPADSLVIREIGKAARHQMCEAGVARVLWRAG